MGPSLDELCMKAEPCTLLERIQSALENLGGSSNKRPREETSSEAGDQPAKKTRPSFAAVAHVRISQRVTIFISTQEFTVEAIGYTKEQKLAVAMVYFASTICKLWSLGLEILKRHLFKELGIIAGILFWLLGDATN